MCLDIFTKKQLSEIIIAGYVTITYFMNKNVKIVGYIFPQKKKNKKKTYCSLYKQDTLILLWRR